MKILTVTLKQHTPLIHFQHEQEGATLRASEVKPKLDKFLKIVLEEDNDIGEEVLKFCRRKQPNVTTEDVKDVIFNIFNGIKKADAWMDMKTKSFHYKLKIIAKEKDKVSIPIPIRENNNRKYEASFPFLLSNMGGKEEKEKLINFSFYTEIQFQFMAHDPILLNKINQYLDSFMATTNFGYRQDKGFGSFFRKDKSLDAFKESLIDEYGDGIFMKKSKQNFRLDYSSFENMFKEIDNDYKKLKAGINNNPSLLKSHFEKNYNYDWEKTAIKNIMKKQPIPPNIYYLRILLGLTEGMAYIKEKSTVNIEHLPEGQTEEERKKNKIERFQSPLTIKIFENMLFILPEDINTKIYGQRFKFSIIDDETGKEKCNPFELKSVEKFNLEIFLNSELKNLGWGKITQNNKQ
jgi:hypothetical protein